MTFEQYQGYEVVDLDKPRRRRDSDMQREAGRRMLSEGFVQTTAEELEVGRRPLPEGGIGGIKDDSNPLLWKLGAVCSQVDPELFFPERGGSTNEAKRICQGCDVSSTCLEYAIEKDERFGVWGGLSERERRRFSRRTQ